MAFKLSKFPPKILKSIFLKCTIYVMLLVNEVNQRLFLNVMFFLNCCTRYHVHILYHSEIISKSDCLED